jgi:hypothetical protein
MKLLRATQAFFFINAAAMLTVGVLTLIRPPQATPGLTILTAVLLWIDAGLLAGCALVVAKGQKWLNLTAVAVLLVNLLLTLLDDFGLPDLIVLILFIFNLGLLFLSIKKAPSNP